MSKKQYIIEEMESRNQEGEADPLAFIIGMAGIGALIVSLGSFFFK